MVEIKKTIKKKIREDLRTFDEHTAKTIIESTWSTRKVKRALANGRNLLPELANEKGEKISDRNRIAEMVTSFFSALYKDHRGLGNHPPEWRKLVEKGSQIPPITKSEVVKTIRKVKVSSAPGPDSISNEVLLDFGEVIAGPLAGLFNSILTLGYPPKQWLLSEIILIHKKGSLLDINNYRPVSLSSCIQKIFMVILKNKCYNCLDA